jgi:hypothetical protein
MVKWKNKFHEKRALQKLMHYYQWQIYRDKTNEIFNIEEQFILTLLMLLLLKE